jgi:hypothetical protein
MLTFIDTRKGLVIFRTDLQPRPKAQPQRMGFVSKRTFEVALEPGAELTRDEDSEVREVAERLRHVKSADVHAKVWRFLEFAREIAEHYRMTSDQLERRLIGKALEQALREVRRHDRNSRRESSIEADPVSIDVGAVTKRMRARVRAAQLARAKGDIGGAQAIVETIVRDTPEEARNERWYDSAVGRSKDFGHLLAKAADKRRIYIVGCGRSGTWFALGMMSTFAGTYITPEERHFGHFAAILTRPEPVHVVKRMHSAHVDFQDVPACIDIVYLLRDPRDVLTSRHGQTENYISIKRWTDEMIALKRLLASSHPSVSVIRFEDLATMPDKVQARLSSELGLAVAHPATDFHRVYRPTPSALMAMHSLRPPDREAVGRWRRDPAQVAFIERLLPEITKTFAPIAERFGYDLAR